MEYLTSNELMILLARQLDATSHPYTCKCGVNLYPIKSGWVCGICGYFQKYGVMELEIVGRNENK